jgi:hypothetical protein
VAVLVLMALNVAVQRARARRDVRATGIGNVPPGEDIGLELAGATARG